ncbi:MAG TPA: hypothetical protein VGN88_04850, partial [Phycisphaerae bacterium]
MVRFPADKAVDVNPDTHLVLTFPDVPAIGNAGKITIFDAATDKPVDTLDMSIPPGPAAAGRGGARAGAPAAGGAAATYSPVPY